MGLFRKDDGVSERLKGEAVALGLCEEWQSQWLRKTSRDELADKFIRGLDFCIEHDWPSCEFIKREFPEDVRHNHGVYVDEEVRGDVFAATVVLMGKCSADLSFAGYDVRDVYVRHDSVLRLVVGGEAKVFVNVYDTSRLDVRQEGNAKVYVYRYGGVVSCAGKVAVRERSVRSELETTDNNQKGK